MGSGGEEAGGHLTQSTPRLLLLVPLCFVGYRKYSTFIGNAADFGGAKNLRSSYAAFKTA